MKDSPQNCHEVRAQLALLLYGELSFDGEERIESHLDGCAECRKSLEQERARHAAFDHYEVTPSPALLRECREDLRERLMNEPAPRPVHTGWWEKFVDAITLQSTTPGWLRPIGVMALLTIGFFAARVAPDAGFRGTMASLVPGAARVRYVEPSADGKIQIVLDETRQRVISGRLDDQQIKMLLLTAAKDPSDPGLRAETVDLLNTRAQSADVRDALIAAVEHDQNAGVRMKAMEGLKAFSEEPAVRAALVQVLMSDPNQGLRTQAIDLLTKSATVDRQIVGTLQELMLRGEQQGYVRERCRRVLESMNASLETY